MTKVENRARRLEGRVALVTGAGGEIGRGIARCLAEEGASLALADISPEGAASCCEEVAAMGAKAVAIPLDVTQAAECEATVDKVCSEFGGLDILVNNAGVIGGPNFKLGLPLSDISEADWDATYSVNVKGVFLLCRAALPVMQEAKWGRIVNISSRAGRHGTEALPHYSASKAAVIIFTQALAREVGRYGITANAICPGLIWSAMWENLAGLYRQKFPHLEGLSSRQVFDDFVNSTPLRREQTPDDIGRAAAFLSSGDACTITGQALLVDSGAVMG
ncbi:MAG: SDR family oxidoreductase [Nitrospinaceae bacterium]|jgi:meso-butanediol dehydrogenase / (S,S)-butanediol dehydrogenase / diacetyl reductase|nr:SDR family oxidoreductase [Nitrospinaceae bacterium]MBT3435638.1 SDR family oxidoreductase [Nitrospinaceae bacterium]MBT3822451.1 SDR family oxidoreductase [Nitrospinaceae bacterium]MBT4093312.1 SDR family oxidoreductase [Nitrospinaceae bacterium]MBT4430468.1 SDR family oxidoreductase [Nitrospinaceae bacterium]